MPSGPPARRESSVRSIILIVLLGLVVIAGVAFGAKQLLGGDDTKAPPAPNKVVPAGGDAQASSGSDAGGGGSNTKKGPATPPRKERTVMVYNGTTTPNLAADLKDQLTNAGYTDANVGAGNVPPGTGPVTTSAVFYKRGAGTQARDVARVLGISTAQVKPIDAALQANAPDKSVIVEIGADKSGD